MPEDKKDKAQRVSAEDPRLQQQSAAPLPQLLGIFAALVGGASLIVGLLWWLVTKSFGMGPKVLIIVAAVCLVYAVAVNISNILGSLRDRRMVTGLNTVVFAIVIVGILVLVNVIAIRHPFFRYDSTKNKQFSLSEQTQKVIQSLDEDVKMVAFMSPEYWEGREVRERIESYSALSPRLKVEVYDPTTRVDKVKEYNVSVDGMVIVECGGRKEDVMGGDEERLTSALLAVTTGEKTKIYFLSGHGEYDPSEMGPESCASIKSALESQQYAIETLTMLNQDAPMVPADAAALVIAGAQHPLPDKEMDAIRQYADQGGKLFIALANTPKAPDFAGLLTPRGVTPRAGKVFDPNAQHNAGAPSVPAVLKPESHDITKRLQAVVLPMARALELEESDVPPPSYPGAPPPPPSQKAQALMKSSADAWLDDLGEAGQGDGERGSAEQAGPLVMAAAIDESKKDKPPTPPGMPPQPEDDEEAAGTRIVVVADAEFMTDRLIQNAQIWGNAVFALNSINWLVSNEKLISIPPKDTETPYLTMVGAQKAIAAVITLFVVPGLVVLAGAIVWWRRRR